ncbi:MAG: PRD domain-containing protein [Clostridiales bacterium]|nr:PRD domain-containing protein [Clostridiales bacterium]
MQYDDYIVEKVFNNNVLLVKHKGKEKIVIKKGLGFQKKQGDCLSSNIRFDKIFILENNEVSNNFRQLVTRVDDDIIGICEEILSFIDSEVDTTLDENVHVRLIDHIAFTLERIKQKDTIVNPFIVEIEILYPKEMELAERAVRMLEKRTGICIPYDEVGSIALHIHSAINKDKISNSIKYAYIANSAVEIIEDKLNIEISRNSIDYARFISHIRFAVERIIKEIPIKNDLISSIKTTYKQSYNLASEIARFIEGELYKKVPEEEVGYITIHVERLKNASI